METIGNDTRGLEYIGRESHNIETHLERLIENSTETNKHLGRIADALETISNFDLENINDACWTTHPDCNGDEDERCFTDVLQRIANSLSCIG